MTVDTPPLAERTVVVTGASSGNGRTIALALARAGARVICGDVRAEPLLGGFETDPSVPTHELIAREGGSASFVQTDVTSAGAVEALADDALARGGRLDAWVNNAGFVSGGTLEQETEEAWQRALAVNVTGTWFGCRAAAARMKRQEPLGRSRGHIVNVGSVAASFGNTGLGAYSASKGAVHALTRALATELGPSAINVNAVVPGFLPTQMNRPIWDDAGALEAVLASTPLPEAGRQADVAHAVLFLTAEASDWITGVLLPVDGGFSAIGSFSTLVSAFSESAASPT